MPQQRLRAVFMRGGTSKAVMFRQDDLPADRDAWAPIFLAIMGSPDPNGRQLDGMGGGISSLSKICVIGPPSRNDADVDYTFAQVAVDRAIVDYSGNCGNMSSAVGPFAVDERIVPRPNGGNATVRIHNTNTRKIIISRFGMDGENAAVTGDLALDGVAGTGAPIRLDFADPAGARTGRLLPTGRATDTLDLGGFGRIEASVIDAANPCVFVRAADLDRTATERPDALERDTALLDKLEAIRRAASVAMGIAHDADAAGAIPGIPKVAMLAAPAEFRTLSGRVLTPGDTDILVRMISVGQPHRAVPLTGALCLAVACRVPGSIPHRLAGAGRNGDLRIGHASGVVLVAADARITASGIEVPYATVYRTARRLFQGEVFYPTLERRQAT
ncbi:MAG TPA: PrpF domain-containing protein [Acetobacteraceae bacterium]|nr:PrpF domain-containing protein [Acetobacteraceae bacterium]